MTRIERLRNIGISAHIDSGKTTLTERMLYYCGRIHAMHDVRGSDNVGATMDSDPIERKRGITISSAVTSVNWKDHELQIIDTPGHVDFTIEVERSLRVLDGAVLVLCSVGGVQSQSLTVDRQMARYKVPRIAFINKMDRIGAAPGRVVIEMRERLKANAVAIQLPIGVERGFKGVVDLITMQAVYFDGEYGEVVRRDCIPATLQSDAEAARSDMLEALALIDDGIMEKLVGEDTLTVDVIQQAIRRATVNRKMTPVMFGSAYRNCGVQELLDAIAAYLPSPVDRQVYAYALGQNGQVGEQPDIELKADEEEPPVALAFKTTVESFGPVTYVRVFQGHLEKGKAYVNSRTNRQHRFSKLVRMHADQRSEIDRAEAGDICGIVGLDSAMGDTYVDQSFRVALENMVVAEPVVKLSIEPARREDADRLTAALERFRRQDPTFRYWNDESSGQLLIAGMGELHLEVYLQRLRDDFKCKTNVSKPQVAYKERPTKSVSFSYRLKKQNGGQGQFAEISGRLDPLPPNSDSDFEFCNEVIGGRISKPFIPAVRDGIAEAMTRGLLGYPVVGARVVLLDGMEHAKDSSELAFNRCAWHAMREKVMPEADLELLEPIVHLSAQVPSPFYGAVVGNLTRKRANVSSTQELDGTCRIESQVPLAEVLSYASELRSLTQGNGTFDMVPAGYASVPQHIAAKQQ